MAGMMKSARLHVRKRIRHILKCNRDVTPEPLWIIIGQKEEIKRGNMSIIMFKK
jgi:hypothetical protein